MLTHHTHIQKISIFANIQNANPPWNLELNLLYLLSLRPLFFPFRTKKWFTLSSEHSIRTRTILKKKYCNRINSKNQSSENRGCWNAYKSTHTMYCIGGGNFCSPILSQSHTNIFYARRVRLTYAKRFYFIRYVSVVFRICDGDLMILSYKN